MKFKLVIFCAFLSFSLNAQHSYLGAFIGANIYEGDLSPTKYNQYINHLRPALGVFGKTNLNSHFDWKYNLNIGSIHGSDSYEGRSRNLHFQSILVELGTSIEWNLIEFKPLTKKRSFTPFLTAGIAGFHFNPKAKYQGDLVSLHPLSTEGQGIDGRPESYSKLQIAIPIGGGLKFSFPGGYIFTLELAGRKLFTDYLDDVSTTYPNKTRLGAEKGNLAVALSNRSGEKGDLEGIIPFEEGNIRGSDKYKDWYFTGGVTFSILLNSSKNGKGIFCPDF